MVIVKKAKITNTSIGNWRESCSAASTGAAGKTLTDVNTYQHFRSSPAKMQPLLSPQSLNF